MATSNQPLKASAMRVFQSSYSEGWTILQQLHTTSPNGNPDQDVVYVNSLYSILIQIEYEPACRMPMFQSLIDFAYNSQNLVGLDTIFLTLLHHAHLVKGKSDKSDFNRGVEAWKQFANSEQNVKSASPLGFYNVSNKKMTVFSSDTAECIRNGHIEIWTLDNIGKILEDNAEYEADDAFGSATAKKGILFFNEIGQPDVQGLHPAGLLIGVAIGIAILLYATNAWLLPDEQDSKDSRKGFTNVAAVAIVIGSLQADHKVEKMVKVLKKLKTITVPLPEEKEVRGNSLVMDGNGTMNIWIEPTDGDA